MLKMLQNDVGMESADEIQCTYKRKGIAKLLSEEGAFGRFVYN
jgi:hypothetical protein